MVSTDIHNAEFLLKKIQSSKGLEENKKLVLDYYHEKLASDSNLGSLVNYLKILSRLVDFSGKPFKELPKQELIDFFINLKPCGVYLPTKKGRFLNQVAEYSPQTLIRMKANVKVFWKWMFQGDSSSPRDDAGVPLAVSWIKTCYRGVKSRHEKEVLSRDEAQNMIKVSKNIRTKALIAILFESGMRAGELLGMKNSQLVFHDDFCEFVCDGKTGKRPVILVKSYPFLSQWLDYAETRRKDIPAKYKDIVWLNMMNFGHTGITPLSRDGLRNLLKYAGERAGIKKRVWTHGFRHSSATDFAKQGYNETELRLKYGWTATSNIPSNYTHYKHDELKNKILRHSGKSVSEPEPDGNILKLKECPFCGSESPFDSSFCGKCSKPLDVKMVKEAEKQAQALTTMQEIITKLGSMENKGFDLQAFNRFMETWVKTNAKQ